jgi:hypothetical protein
MPETQPQRGCRPAAYAGCGGEEFKEAFPRLVAGGGNKRWNRKDASWFMTLSPLRETAMFGQGGNIASAMQDAHDHQFPLIMHVIDAVISRRAGPEPRRKLLPRGARKRKVAEWLACAPELVDQPGCRRLGRFQSDVRPDFSEVGFCGISQTEGERSAKSFLPRSMMRAVSKSLTRPAATSASPASISDFSAASSSS